MQMQTSSINGGRSTSAAFLALAQHRVLAPGPGTKAKDEGSPRATNRQQVLDSTRSSGEANSNGGHFRVVIRVRPPLDRELCSPVWQNVVTVSSETQVCLHEVIPDGSADQGSGTIQVVNSHFFTFDCVYDQDTSQPDVYARAARASVLSTLQGYNATILAYGPTGTGKTYTMEGKHAGEPASFGIIPRSMEEIFTHIRDCKGPQDRFLVRASYLQIYNEVVSDLLKPERNHLVIREDRRRGVFVEGLSEWLCRSPSEVHMLMVRGSSARATAQTGANDASSRSHAVFLIVVEQSEVLPDDRTTTTGAGGARDPYDSTDNGSVAHCIRVGRLNLVDLAGSERPRLTGATGQRLEETKKINQSLSALGNVIATLTERPARQHVPYRDSKLTRLLEDSLGGNCRTTMMAMVSPAAEAFAETLSTLKFAYRAKAVTNTPHVNEDVDQRTLIRRYEAELRRLRAELRECGVDKQQLLELEEGRRRAEEDRQAAVSALQERALVLEWEKAQKEQLEQRIRELSSQLLAGGRQAQETGQPCHEVLYQERAQTESSEKLAELERERPTSEDDTAQVGRYKQLLFKQRDIMIALTQRLHERDEMIVGLQDEIDARDKRLAALQGPVVPQSSKEHLGGGVWQDRRYPAEGSTFDRPVRLLTADEKITELSAELHSRTQESHRLRLELESLQGALAQAQQMKQETGGTCGSTTRSAAAPSVPQSVCSSTTRPAAAPAGTTPSSMPGASAGELLVPARSIGGDATVHGMAEEHRHSLSPEAMQASLTPEGVRRGVTPRAECRGRRSPSQESGRQLGRSRALIAEAAGAKRRANSLGSASIPSLGSTVASTSDPSAGSARLRPGDASTSCSAGSIGSGGRSSTDLRANSDASAEEAAPSSTPLLAQAGPILKPWLIGRLTNGSSPSSASTPQRYGGTHQDMVTPANDTPGRGLAQKAAAATNGSKFSELMSKFAVPSTPGSLRRSASCTGVPDGSAGGTVGSGLLPGRGPVRAAPLQGGTTAAVARSAMVEAKPWWQAGGEAATPAATATGAGGAAGTSAQALREEAQRSVDALLARRRAELQRNMARA